jgi:molybdenum cofactor guanylyltransferase
MDGSPDVTAFILAGGKSTRMGTDKAFVEYQGRMLLARALALARSVTVEVRIVGSKEKFAPFAPVVEDVFLECGPLGGIHAALQTSQTDLNLMLSVDTPFVSSAFLGYLIGEAEKVPDATAIVPHAGGSSQPLCAIYRRGFSGVAEAALRAGQNKIDRLFLQVRTRVISQEELERAGFSAELFRNLNTPEELSKDY